MHSTIIFSSLMTVTFSLYFYQYFLHFNIAISNASISTHDSGKLVWLIYFSSILWKYTPLINVCCWRPCWYLPTIIPSFTYSSLPIVSLIFCVTIRFTIFVTIFFLLTPDYSRDILRWSYLLHSFLSVIPENPIWNESISFTISSFPPVFLWLIHIHIIVRF